MRGKADIVLGRVPVLACLQAGRRMPRRLYVQQGAKGLEKLMRAAPPIPVERRDKNALDKLSRGVLHQGVILEADPLPLLDEKALMPVVTAPNAFVVVLDGVEDPHNFGAIVRSAAACGASAVVFGKDRSAPLSPAMTKAAAGGVEHVPMAQVPNLVRVLGRLQEAGFWFAVLDAGGDRLLWEADLTGRVGLVIGSEGKGVRRLLRQRCDMGVRIPIRGAITSLNASVSAGIALVECLRQRHNT